MQIDLDRARDIHTQDPGAVKEMIDALTEGLLGDMAGVLLRWGEDLWWGLALILIVWTGSRIALSGGFSAWDLVRLVTALMIPRTMLEWYAAPIPGVGMTLPQVIVGQGAAIADLVMGDVYSSSYTWVSTFVTRAFAEALAGWQVGVVAGLVGTVVGGPEAIAGLVLAILAIVMGVMGLLLVVIGYAQVIWAQFAIGIAAVFGPIFIPWLLFEPMAFLFWGWFRTMITYSLYSAVAACVYRVFLGAVMAATDGIWDGLTLDFAALGASLMWIVSYVVLAVAGVLAAFKIPELASALVSGSVGGGGMLGALWSAATVGKAAVAKGRALLRGGK